MVAAFRGYARRPLAGTLPFLILLVLADLVALADAFRVVLPSAFSSCGASACKRSVADSTALSAEAAPSTAAGDTVLDTAVVWLAFVDFDVDTLALDFGLVLGPILALAALDDDDALEGVFEGAFLAAAATGGDLGYFKPIV